MMFLPRLYARLCARQAGRTLMANRIAQNYSQFMPCPEADVPADFLHQNAHELSGFNFVEQIFPPALWGATFASICMRTWRSGRRIRGFTVRLAPCFWACAGRALA